MVQYSAVLLTFQPALPLRGATLPRFGNSSTSSKFQPALPLRGATVPPLLGLVPMAFQPALPLRGATAALVDALADAAISTRAPLAGSDAGGKALVAALGDFNPRSPCGERRQHTNITMPWCNFNPRSPCGERPLHFVALLYYRRSIVFSKTVAKNSADKSRKTAAKNASAWCEPLS